MFLPRSFLYPPTPRTRPFLITPTGCCRVVWERGTSDGRFALTSGVLVSGLTATSFFRFSDWCWEPASLCSVSGVVAVSCRLRFRGKRPLIKLVKKCDKLWKELVYPSSSEPAVSSATAFTFLWDMLFRRSNVSWIMDQGRSVGMQGQSGWDGLDGWGAVMANAT